ncbi:DUF4158 domain-containing protein [Streptosporangium sp. NBC_01810]|uniref:DUF4158 domain-containing protein n=1 Tax=Streptosporangium sp. NBC_01810 TaxID=2975951 RepID=UPI002DD8B6B5|nr:DUF4158 domain-containing protein [Streptosporangium sp. NBC_01810]WSA28637.1 DUF4158 domain-containing protein [Streptosporangium sp. NBC_01810]
MPVEFLTDDEAAAYGRFAGPPARADLERVFFLDDEDRALVGRRRGEHMKLGFALQLVTVRWLGTFLEDPLDVPGVVLEFVAEQLGVEDPSQVKRYTERRPTPFDHQQEIRQAYGWKDFASVEPEFVAWVAARSWTSGDGSKAIFTDGVGWLRERKALLPGVTTLARLVAKIREDTTKRLWGALEGLLTIGQRYVLDQMLEVPPGSRVSDLERWRKGVAPRASGPTIIKALDQVAEICGLELAELGAEALVPQRRLGELAKYGMRADASALRRHPDGRRLATLLATVRFLEGKSVDDTLELLDLLMATEDEGAAGRPGLPQPPARAADPRPPGRRRCGDRPVAAPGVRAPGPRGRLGEPARLRLLRAGAVLARLEAPRDLRRRLHQVAQPSSRAAGRSPVGGDPARRAHRAQPSRRPRRAACRALPDLGRRPQGGRRTADRQPRRSSRWSAHGCRTSTRTTSGPRP